MPERSSSKRRTSVIDYLQEKKTDEFQLRREELEYKCKKLEFEERKYDAEKKERENWLHIESEERKAFINFLLKKANQ